MKIDTRLLTNLLKRTQRHQHVAGKAQPQVQSTILYAKEDRVTTTNLVRDGKTSLSVFRLPAETDGTVLIPIADIDKALGILSAHGSPVSVTLDYDRVVFKSGRKTTRLISSIDGTAFLHGQETIQEWSRKSDELANKFVFDDGEFKGYTMRDGSLHEPLTTITVDCNEFYDALKADSINNQKLNRYQLAVKDGVIRIGVGDEMKGFTFTDLEHESKGIETFEWTFEGGLDNVMFGLGGTCQIHFLDFRELNQGMRIVIDFGEAGWVYQAGIIE